MHTDAPRNDHKKILASEDEMFKFNEFGAHAISLTTSFCRMTELSYILTKSQTQTTVGDYSLIVAAKFESGLTCTFETPTLGSSESAYTWAI